MQNTPAGFLRIFRTHPLPVNANRNPRTAESQPSEDQGFAGKGRTVLTIPCPPVQFHPAVRYFPLSRFPAPDTSSAPSPNTMPLPVPPSLLYARATAKKTSENMTSSDARIIRSINTAVSAQSEIFSCKFERTIAAEICPELSALDSTRARSALDAEAIPAEAGKKTRTAFCAANRSSVPIPAVNSSSSASVSASDSTRIISSASAGVLKAPGKYSSVTEASCSAVRAAANSAAGFSRNVSEKAANRISAARKETANKSARVPGRAVLGTASIFSSRQKTRPHKTKSISSAIYESSRMYTAVFTGRQFCRSSSRKLLRYFRSTAYFSLMPRSLSTARTSSLPQGACIKTPNDSSRNPFLFFPRSNAYLRFLSLHTENSFAETYRHGKAAAICAIKNKG